MKPQVSDLLHTLSDQLPRSPYWVIRVRRPSATTTELSLRTVEWATATPGVAVVTFGESDFTLAVGRQCAETEPIFAGAGVSLQGSLADEQAFPNLTRILLDLMAGKSPDNEGYWEAWRTWLPVHKRRWNHLQWQSLLAGRREILEAAEGVA